MTKAKKVLIIDNGSNYIDDLENSVKEQAGELGKKIEIERKSIKEIKETYDNKDIDFIQGYDGIISSGIPKSRDYDTKIHRFVADNAKPDAYVLGVCHGHQQLAKAYGAKITNSGKMNKGYKEVIVTAKKHELFEGVAEEGVIKVYGHHQFYVESKNVGENIEVLAESKSKTGDTIVEAYQVKGKNHFGVQFHPEKQHEEKAPHVRKIFYNVLSKMYEKAA